MKVTNHEHNWKFQIGNAEVIYSNVKLLILNICQASTKCKENLKTQAFC